MALATDPDPLRRALNRLTFGARQEDVAYARTFGLEGWLANQFATPGGDEANFALFLNSQSMQIRYNAPAANDTRGMWMAVDEMRPLYYLAAPSADLWSVAIGAGSTYAPAERTRIRQELIAATWIRNAHSPYQLREFMADFWNNHFNIGKAENELATAMLPVYDREAIRPHVFGNFRTMLEATATSSSMLIYLDNWLSTANVPNENYAREIIELHTLGGGAYLGVNPSAGEYKINADGIADSYTDADVLQASRALSGWTIKAGQRANVFVPSTGEFLYNPMQHNRNASTILNYNFAPLTADMAQGRKLIDILAAHPRTGTFIVSKLCRRIFGDNPPASVLIRGIDAWNANRTDAQQIRKVIEAIVLGGSEILNMNAAKVRRPYERLIAMARTTGILMNAGTDLATVLDGLNDGPYAWQGPNGRPDVDSYWLASGSVLTTWNNLISFPSWRSNATNLTNETPASVRTSATNVVEYWVDRMVGHALAPERMTALINDQATYNGVPSAAMSNSASRLETNLRRLVSMIATSLEFTYR